VGLDELLPHRSVVPRSVTMVGSRAGSTSVLVGRVVPGGVPKTRTVFLALGRKYRYIPTNELDYTYPRTVNTAISVLRHSSWSD